MSFILLALLRHNRGFSIFLGTQGVSNLGDAVRSVAVPLFLLQLTHAPTLVAALAVLEVAPAVALQLPCGALVDRWDRRRALLLADLGRGLLTLVIPATALAHGPIVPVLFATAVPLSALSALFGAGFGSGDHQHRRSRSPAAWPRWRWERSWWRPARRSRSWPGPCSSGSARGTSSSSG